MAVAALLEARNQGFSLVCNKFEFRDTRMAQIVWVFYLTKIFDFMDTLFIVYRGKWEQFRCVWVVVVIWW